MPWRGALYEEGRDFPRERALTGEYRNVSDRCRSDADVVEGFVGFPAADIIQPTVIDVSGIASAEAFGSATVAVGAASITASGIASSETWGATTVAPGAVTITATGIASAEAWGSATVSPQPPTLSPTGIASAEAWGTAVLTRGAVSVAATSITTAEAWGTTVVQPDAVAITPGSIASGEAFGTLQLTVGAVSVLPSGIASAQAFGTAQVSVGAVAITATSIASDEAWGTAAVLATGAVAPSSIASTEAWGAVSLRRSEVFPLRGIFYYSWFDETWTVGGQPTKWTPTLGNYDLDGTPANAIFDQHIDWMDYAKVDVAILSWWAQDDGNINLTGVDHNEGTRIPRFIDRLEGKGSPFKFCMYYESEGFGDPTVAQIQSDLSYIRTNYVARRDYLYVAGKPVIFVYNSGDTDVANSLQRWSDATNGFADWYVVMKVFTNFATATPAPSSWHQYGPASRSAVHSPYSYVVSPGYWQANDPDPPGPDAGGDFPYLPRDVAAFAQVVRGMATSGNNWQLVTTFNEWGEGTNVEPSTSWGTVYLDVLAADGIWWIGPTSISSAEAFGAPTVQSVAGLAPTGIASSEAWGSTTLQGGPVSIAVGGIPSAQAFGTATVTLSGAGVTMTGIPSAQAFGTPTVAGGAVSINLTGIASAQAFGTPTVAAGTVRVITYPGTSRYPGSFAFPASGIHPMLPRIDLPTFVTLDRQQTSTTLRRTQTAVAVKPEEAAAQLEAYATANTMDTSGTTSSRVDPQSTTISIRRTEADVALDQYTDDVTMDAGEIGALIDG